MPPTPSASNHSKSASRQILVVLAIAIFFTAMALIILQNVLGPWAPKSLQSYNRGYEDGFRDARTQLGIIPNTTQPTSSLTGTILSISGNTLRVKIQIPLSMDVKDDERTVTVASDAAIQIVTPISPEDYARAVRNAGPATEDNPPPESVTREDGTLQDLKVGDVVELNAAPEENIRTKESFTAIAVSILAPLPMAPALVPSPPITPPESTPPTPSE